MTPGRRTLVVLAALALVAAPAAVLRVGCPGNACRASSKGPVRVPFCSLPADVRELVSAGFVDGRSPDVVAVTGGRTAAGWSGPAAPADRVPWPSSSASAQARVPIVLAGAGIATGHRLSAGSPLDGVAPTLAAAIGLGRPPLPSVHSRSGGAFRGATESASSRLVVEVAWVGVGSGDLRSSPDAWPFLRGLLRRGTGTLDGTTGSVPVDPAAVLATYGTGGLPAEHGVAGELERGLFGGLVRPWTAGAPPMAIPTLADDLDHVHDQAAVVGLVGRDRFDLGLTGGQWYVGSDRDLLDLGPGGPPDRARAAVRMLRDGGFGSDGTTDVLGVVLRGPVPELDRATSEIVAAGERASGGALTVSVVGTGSAAPPPGPSTIEATRIGSSVTAALGAGGGRVVSAAAPGGLFLDQTAVARAGISTGRIADALRAMRDGGHRVFADAFPSFAVSLVRFC